jgi:hypothetical protein
VSVQTAQGKTERIVAIMNLYSYQTIYYHLVVSGKVIGYVPQCLDGAVTGDSTSGAAITCDLVTSVFLIGDIRDFAIHSYHLYGDAEDCVGKECKFNLPTYVFSITGIGLSVAGVFTGGVLLVPDAVIAVLKVVSKQNVGAKPLMYLAKYIDDVVLPAPVSQWAQKMEVILPVAQVVGVGYWFGDDIVGAGKTFKDFLTEAIQTPEDFTAWVNYLQRVISADATAAIVADKAETQIAKVMMSWLVATAHAATSDAINKILSADVVKFRQVIEAVAEVKIPGKGPKSQIGQSFTQALKELDELAAADGTSDIAKIIDKSPTVKAFALVYHVAEEEGIAAL